MDQTQLGQLRSIAEDAARLAGAHALAQMPVAQGTLKQGYTGEELVTQVDRACQEIIIRRIQQDRPGDGFLAEEGQAGKLHRTGIGSASVWWVIDPIDGTNNYAHRMPVFAVSIAAMVRGRPAVGVIFDPALDRMTSAIEGGPSRVNGDPVACGSEGLSLFASVGLDSHFGAEGPPPWVDRIMAQTRFRNLGTTAQHLAYVASGAMVGMVGCLPKLWDIAAGALIVECARGVVTDWQGLDVWPIDPATYDGRKLPVVAANCQAHGQILRIMRGT